MKNTIRDTVEETYDTNVNNIQENPSISASKILTSMQESQNIETKPLAANIIQRQNNRGNGSPSLLLILLGLLLVAFIGAIFYFRDKIKPHLHKFFDSLSPKKNEKKNEKKTNKQEPEEEEEKKPIHEKKTDPPKKTEKINNDNYPDNQIVKEDDMYCYLGEDDNTRQCIQAFRGDVCTSGDIFNRIDQCLVPS